MLELGKSYEEKNIEDYTLAEIKFFAGRYLVALNYASRLFQPGHKFDKALSAGQSCVIDGMKWMEAEIDKYRA